MSPSPVRRSALPLAWFRILFGACMAWDVSGLFVHAPLWFDEVPFSKPSRIPVEPFLGVWFAAAVGLALGALTRLCAVANYLGCVVFLGFAGMARGYEYHCDNLYLLASFGLMFLPVSRRFAVDARRRPPRDRTVGRGPEVFLALVVSSIYFDSAVWKLSSRMWIEGLGYWAPASQPLDAYLSLRWTLEHEWLARAAGYVTLAYELGFVLLVWVRRLRVPLLGVGFVLHLGIGTLLPLPRFGLLMFALLAGLIPLRADTWAEPEPELERHHDEGVTSRRAPVAAFYTVWAAVFLLGVLEPLALLGRYGLGGLEGSTPRPWHATSQHPLARLQTRTLVWSYRLFGFRSHPIFVDSQFSEYDVETRLARGGQRIHPPLRNRHYVAWHYRRTWPRLPREHLERNLIRFAEYAAHRAELDLEREPIAIQQRRIEVPVDGWRAGQLARNLASPWETVGALSGPPGALRVRWSACADRHLPRSEVGSSRGSSQGPMEGRFQGGTAPEATADFNGAELSGNSATRTPDRGPTR